MSTWKDLTPWKQMLGTKNPDQVQRPLSGLVASQNKKTGLLSKAGVSSLAKYSIIQYVYTYPVPPSHKPF